MSKATTWTVSGAGKELLLIINCESELTIYAVDRKGVLVSNFSITTPYGSLPSCMGFTVIGSYLHMMGGFPPENDESKDRYSMKTYVLDIGKIPASGGDLSPHLTPGPLLNSGKLNPVVYVVRNRIYALSSAVHGLNSTFSDFEFRNLEERDWTKLPNPPVPVDVELRSSFASLVSHALVGEESIVISLTTENGKWRGAYAFDLDSTTWTSVQDPISFTGQTISSNGFFYAPSPPALGVPATSALQIFCGNLSSPHLIFKLRETLPQVSIFTTHRIAVMGGVIFIIRSGSPEVPDNAFGSPVYITIDRYNLSVNFKPRFTELDHSEPLLLIKDDYYRGSTVRPYCLPVSLSVSAF